MKTYLGVVVVAVGFAVAGPPAAAQAQSWKGKGAFPTRPTQEITFFDISDGKPVSLLLSGRLLITVREEHGGWIRIHDGRREGWADKSQFVLVSDAGAYFDRRVQSSPKDTWAIFMCGFFCLVKGNSDNAIQDFDEAIRLDPKNALAFNNRGWAWHSKRDYDRAIKDYDEAIRLDPKNPSAFNNRGNAWVDKGDLDQAIKDYDEAIRLDPKYASAFNDRGIAWVGKGDLDRAIQDFDEAIRLDPKYALAFLSRGLAWLFKQDLDRALKDFDEAIRLDPKYASAFNNRGRAWVGKGDLDRAIQDFDESIRLAPKNALAFYNRGNAWYVKQDYDRALKDFDESIRLDPKNAYVTILGHLTARRVKNDGTAKRFLQEAAEKWDDSVWPGPIIRFLRGDIDEPALLRLATDNGKRTEARCYLGLDHLLKGRKDDALAHFRWVKQHGTGILFEYMIAVAELERLERSEK